MAQEGDLAVVETGGEESLVVVVERTGERADEYEIPGTGKTLQGWMDTHDSTVPVSPEDEAVKVMYVEALDRALGNGWWSWTAERLRGEYESYTPEVTAYTFHAGRLSKPGPDHTHPVMGYRGGVDTVDPR